MEQLNILLDMPDLFDRAVHGDDKLPSLPSSDDLQIITKNRGTESGRAVAVITWSVMVDGKWRRAQYTVSVRHLHMIAAVLDGAYDQEGFPRR